MNIDKKIQVYTDVTNNAERVQILAKCVEELLELSAEIENTITDIKQKGEITYNTYRSLSEEMADTIITVEQVYGIANMQDRINKEVLFKLNRLMKYIYDGRLTKDIDLTLLD